MKRPFMVWIGFISICCSKVAKEGKSCPRLLVLQRVAQNAKSCSKVAEHNLFMPTRGTGWGPNLPPSVPCIYRSRPLFSWPPPFGPFSIAKCEALLRNHPPLFIPFTPFYELQLIALLRNCNTTKQDFRYYTWRSI